MESNVNLTFFFGFVIQRAGGATPFREEKRDPRIIPALAFFMNNGMRFSTILSPNPPTLAYPHLYHKSKTILLFPEY